MKNTIKVYGFTADKDVHAVDMNAEQITSAGIHPWRLDLFDTQPIVIPVAGTPLSFSPLTTVSFACETVLRGRTIGFVGISEGRARTCLSGTIVRKQSKILQLQDLNICDADTSTELFHRYLRNYVGGQHLANAAPWEAELYKFYPAYPGKHMRLHKEILQYNWESRPTVIGDPSFMGEMFTPLRVRKVLPTYINWLFEAFKGYRPVVFGGILRDCMQGVTPFIPRVDVLVDLNGGWNNMLTHIRQVTDGAARTIRNRRIALIPRIGNNMSFVYQKIEYCLVDRRFNMMDRAWTTTDFSVNQWQAIKPDEVYGSRIAFFDLSRKQARLISQVRRDPLWRPPDDAPATRGSGEEPEAPGAKLRALWIGQAWRLKGKGFRILPNPFSQDRDDRIESSV